jgi:hypothetical protein
MSEALPPPAPAQAPPQPAAPASAGASAAPSRKNSSRSSAGAMGGAAGGGGGGGGSQVGTTPSGSVGGGATDALGAGGAVAAPAAAGGAAAPAPPHRDGPLRKLSVNLLVTYKLINQRYYEAKKAKQAAAAAAAKSSSGAPRAEDYTVTAGDVLGVHYRVEESMGKGSFGQVVSATDTRSGERVAVKVIKNKDAFRRQARTEVRLLEMLNARDPADEWCIGEHKQEAASCEM